MEEELYPIIKWSITMTIDMVQSLIECIHLDSAVLCLKTHRFISGIRWLYDISRIIQHDISLSLDLSNMIFRKKDNRICGDFNNLKLAVSANVVDYYIRC